MHSALHRLFDDSNEYEDINIAIQKYRSKNVFIYTSAPEDIVVFNTLFALLCVDNKLGVPTYSQRKPVLRVYDKNNICINQSRAIFWNMRNDVYWFNPLSANFNDAVRDGLRPLQADDFECGDRVILRVPLYKLEQSFAALVTHHYPNDVVYYDF